VKERKLKARGRSHNKWRHVTISHRSHESISSDGDPSNNHKKRLGLSSSREDIGKAALFTLSLIEQLVPASQVLSEFAQKKHASDMDLPDLAVLITLIYPCPFIMQRSFVTFRPHTNAKCGPYTAFSLDPRNFKCKTKNLYSPRNARYATVEASCLIATLYASRRLNLRLSQLFRFSFTGDNFAASASSSACVMDELLSLIGTRGLLTGSADIGALPLRM